MITLRASCFLAIATLYLTCSADGQKTATNGILISFTDAVSHKSGYKNLRGDIVIPAGKYSFCFTDTFRNYAIVAVPHKGFVAIDRKENIIYNVFPFDNGPDYVEDGLFRIMEVTKLDMRKLRLGKLLFNHNLTVLRLLKMARQKFA